MQIYPKIGQNLNVQIWRGQIHESEHLETKKSDIKLCDGDFDPYLHEEMRAKIWKQRY